MTLFVNACVRENSRTKRLADCLLSNLEGPVTELRLAEMDFPVPDEQFLLQRDRLIAEGALDHPMLQPARQFAGADQIVIAAPFWDLSFPASLKQYLEQINVAGVTFTYTPEGIPKGLCKARHLYYITTAGGEYFPEEYGYGYVKALSQTFYGIPQVDLVKATGLDIDGADEDRILADCMTELRTHFQS